MTGEFPSGFLWGTATAAHQVEGGNTASDLWLMETMKPSLFAEPSGDACDHYHLYPSDIALLRQLGFDTYRFSVEWARIEPEEGFFSKAALDHYRRMIACCLSNGVVPMVTFHHFTAPLWFTRDGGWEDPKSVDRFARYCERAGRALGDIVDYACTINEANIPVMVTMIREAVGVAGGGGRRAKALAEAARLSGGEPERFAPYLSGNGHPTVANLIAAHRKSYEILKPLVNGPVGITLALNDFQAEPGGEELCEAADRAINRRFLEALAGDDFVGVQTYTRVRFGPGTVLPPPDGSERTQMGYEFYPEALEATIRLAARISGCPVIVTENGIGTEDDTRRIEYTRRALEGVLRCLADGIDVRGYIHWSMMDNYEWLEGYRPKFGLVAVDRATQLRTPKPSAHWLGGVARRNRLA
ncbi:MAG TPA: glycoside hydrolase family 1 protein [Rhizomicrobium sp.]|nr:glycoside hydrolase family 1 protein [Rhizomicrobium sp.]